MANTIYAEGKTLEEARAKVLAKAERMGHYHAKEDEIVEVQKLVTKGLGKKKEILQPWKVSLTLDIIGISTPPAKPEPTPPPAEPTPIEPPKDLSPPQSDAPVVLSDCGRVLIKYNGDETRFTVPNGVVEIAEGAFSRSNIEEIDFNEVELIGKSAFAYCGRLEQINFARQVKILDKAFDSCEELSDVHFDQPSVVVGDYAFDRCARQMMITGVVYQLSDCETSLIKFMGQSPTSSAFDLVIPPGVVKIEAEAFMDKDCIKSVDFADVRKIEHHAFESCTKLAKVNFAEVAYIGVSAFEDCNALETITFPKPVELAEACFYQCTNLHTVEFLEPPSIGDAVFERCYALKTVTSEKGFEEVGESAFDKCTSLTSITNLIRVKTIDNSAFRRCESLTRIDLPANIETIKESVFSECKQLEIHCARIRAQFSANWNCGRPVFVNDVLMIEAASEIGDGDVVMDDDKKFVMDKSRTKLIKYIGSDRVVEIPRGIFEVAKEAFINCTNVEEVHFNDVEEVGNYAFDNCENLKTVHLDNVVRVGKSAFEDCSKLVKVTFPEQSSDIIIESSAFFSCKALEEVIFEGSVERIDYAAFGRCGALSSVTFKQKCIEIGANAFEKCDELKSIEKLDGLTSIGDSAFRKCRRLRRIELPDTLYSMGEKAVFAGCDNITIHYYDDSAWTKNWACGQKTRRY